MFAFYPNFTMFGHLNKQFHDEKISSGLSPATP